MKYSVNLNDNSKLRDKNNEIMVEKQKELRNKYLKTIKELSQNDKIGKDKSKHMSTTNVSNIKSNKRKDNENKIIEPKVSKMLKNEYRLKSKISSLKDENKALLEENRMLKNECNTFNTMKINLISSEYETRMKNEELKREIRSLKDIVNNLRQRETTQTTHINMLEDAVIKRNSHIKILNEKYLEDTKLLKLENECLQKEKDVLSKNTNIVTATLEKRYKIFTDKIVVKDKIAPIHEIEEIQFGTIQKYAGVYIFKNVSGIEYLIDMYDINAKRTSIKKYVGNSCRAIVVNNEIAVIDEIYDYNYLKSKKPITDRYKIPKTIISNDMKEFVENGDKYKVLIIGSQNKQRYLSALKLVNITNVTWCDSYSSNYIRLKMLIKQHDIVLCCTSHSRHYASDLVRSLMEQSGRDLKYTISSNDTVINVKARIRYIISNMEEMRKKDVDVKGE